MRSRVLDRAELPVDSTQFARFLIGKMLVHAYRGKTPRNQTLFLERGHAYVYLAYGTSFMLNVSSELPGVGAGVLIRAIEPTDGIALMERNGGTERLRDLARGPGRLCAALGIDLRLDGIDLCREGPLWLGSDGQGPAEIGHGKRIGITRAAERPLRFYLRDDPFVSGPRALNA
jgi:DNA-3-methyladenine glycosylase